MSIEIRVPQLPESVTDATLVAWHKKAGEAVTRDENLVDLDGNRKFASAGSACFFLDFFTNNVVAKLNAFIANKNRRSSNEFSDLMLALSTKGAVQQTIAVTF